LIQAIKTYILRFFDIVCDFYIVFLINTLRIITLIFTSMKKNIIVITVLIGMICSQCSLSDKADQPVSLKKSFETNVARINTALDEISASQAYQLITSGDISLKSSEGYNDSIMLDLISGVYIYQPDLNYYCRHNHDYKLFKKTGPSDSLIVKLPERMVFHPGRLHDQNSIKCDSVWKNNFVIAASDYHYYYSLFDKFDYKLKAGFTLNDTSDIGTLSILANGDSYNKNAYSSEYAFPEKYRIITDIQTGDTTTMEFALLDDEDLLLGESIVFIKGDYDDNGDEENEECGDNMDHEWQYTLSVGNIDIKKSTGIDSIQVFLDGVLQKKAAEIIDDTDTESEHSICHSNRDILLTFDDGTTAKLSELISPALTTLRDLVDSLRSMTFAKGIIDYIAFNIYYSRE
jgi:hypothetical protein